MEYITVCVQLDENTLRVIEEVQLPLTLDDGVMELYATYQGQRYVVNGNIYNWYIVIEE